MLTSAIFLCPLVFNLCSLVFNRVRNQAEVRQLNPIIPQTEVTVAVFILHHSLEASDVDIGNWMELLAFDIAFAVIVLLLFHLGQPKFFKPQLGGLGF